MSDKQPIVVVGVPQAVIDQLNELVTQAETVAAPHIIALSNEQRRKRLKLGPRFVAFVQKCLGYGRAKADYVPSFVDLDGMATNLKTLAELGSVARRFTNLGFTLTGTNMVAGGSARRAGDLIYGRVQEAAENGQPGAQADFNDLKTQYDDRDNDDDTPPAGQ